MYLNLLLGLFAGVFIATVGWHRERRFEKFSVIAWSRSLVIALVSAIVVSVVDFPMWLYTLALIIVGERATSELYKTYIKAEYKPHAVCQICHCTVHKIRGKYVRPK